MRLGKYLLAAAAASMTVAPAIAANPASIESVRAGSVVKGDSEAVGGGILVAVLAAAAVIVGIVIVADSDDEPDSQ
jgi:hypothetical protein